MHGIHIDCRPTRMDLASQWCWPCLAGAEIRLMAESSGRKLCQVPGVLYHPSVFRYQGARFERNDRVKHLQDGTLPVIKCDKWGKIAPVTNLSHFIGLTTPLSPLITCNW